MVVAYFDCFSGISGDMTLGALLDLGMDIIDFKKEIKKLQLTGYSIDVKQVTRNNIIAQDVFVHVDEDQSHRSYIDIKNIITQSKLSESVKKISIGIFERLAHAEGKIHNVHFEDVHFHEVGAIDSIIDIVGTSILLEFYKIKLVYASILPLGNGFVDCTHGRIPVPAPATMELLQDVPVYQSNFDHEMVTPTGAAIITSITDKFGKMPLMKINKIGYGAGKIRSDAPGILRIILGTLE